MSSNTRTRGRRYSSSASPRSRRRSRSSDSYNSYSDSFVSDSEEDRRKGQKKKSNTNKSSKLASVYKTKKPPGRPRMSRSVDSQSVDQVTQRMLSARRLKINDLKSENDELRQLLDEARTETKTLKNTQRRQEKALQKLESQENDLPNIIGRHNEEVRALKDQIKKYRARIEQNRHQYYDINDELQKVKSENKKLRELIDRKELREREDLDRKLTNAEVELDQKDKRIRELERHLDNLTKNHKHELAIEIHRHKDTKGQLDAALQQNEELEKQLNAKTKAMDATNIYSNRGGNRPSSPPTSRKGLSLELDSLTTPRDKAERTKLYELKRREKMKRKQESKQRAEEKRREEKKEPVNETIEESSDDEPEWDREKAKNLSFNFRTDPRKSRDALSDDEFFDTKKRADSPPPVTSEPNREKKPTPRREPSPVREPTPPRSPTPREPTPRTPTPPREPTPPKQPTPPPPQPQKEDPELAEQRRKKDLLLARLRALDEHKDFDDDNEPATVNDKPHYSFSKPIDNLHHGRPTHDDVKVPVIERQKRRQSLQSDSSTSLKNRRNSEDTNPKKKDLMSALFGDSEKEDKSEKTKDSYDYSNLGYQPSTGSRPAVRHQVINKPVVNAVDDHVHEDEIEELIL